MSEGATRLEVVILVRTSVLRICPSTVHQDASRCVGKTTHISATRLAWPSERHGLPEHVSGAQERVERSRGLGSGEKDDGPGVERGHRGGEERVSEVQGWERVGVL